MAKITFGPIIADARGSIAGQTFSANHYGPFIRARVRPSQVLTPARAAQHAIAATINANWKALSLEQRAAWDAFAPLIKFTDTLGRNPTLAGFQAFYKLNGLLASVGAAMQPLPPVNLQANDCGNIQYFQAGMTVNSLLVLVPNLPAATDTPQIWATPPFSVGRRYFGGHQRLIATPAGNPPWDIGAAYFARYGHPGTGSNVGLLVRYINHLTGAPGPWRRLLSTLLPPPMNFADAEIPGGAIDGANLTFTLAHTPNPGLSLALYLNGLFQLQGTDYTLAANVITYGAAPHAGDTLVAYYRY